MFLQPESIVAQFGITHGERIIDCGCGNGKLTLEMVKRVGRDGFVTALDIQKEYIEDLMRQAYQESLTQLNGFVVDMEVPKSVPLKDGSATMVVLANVLFQAHDKKSFLLEALRLLARGGRCIIVEWKDSFAGIGPHPDYIIREELVHTWCDEAGLLYESSLHLGPYQYGVIFRKL